MSPIPIRTTAIAAFLALTACADAPPPAAPPAPSAAQRPQPVDLAVDRPELMQWIASYPALGGPEPRIERVFMAQTIRRIAPGSGVSDEAAVLEYSYRRSGSGLDLMERRTLGKTLWRPQRDAHSASEYDERAEFALALAGLSPLGAKVRRFTTPSNAMNESGYVLQEVRRADGFLFPLAVGNRLVAEFATRGSDGKTYIQDLNYSVRERRIGYVAEGIAVDGDIFEVEANSFTRDAASGRVLVRANSRQFFAVAGNAVIARDIVEEYFNDQGTVQIEVRRKDVPIYFVFGRESGTARAEADRFGSGLNRFIAAFAEEQFRPILELAALGAATRPAAPVPAPALAQATPGQAQPCEKTAGGAVANALLGAGFAAIMGGGRNDMLSAAGNNAVRYFNRPGC
ncbi:MAG: hypothetical protein FJX46_09840 [Alphaproteobacteria bacterium]|nr:hypothetical protein [Alphaproteobacteria bacterium]